MDIVLKTVVSYMDTVLKQLVLYLDIVLKNGVDIHGYRATL